ncbi:MAG: YggS family pyridoxal phosphate-dependent enzyme [Flavobacteriales bacterium]|nr:YggS family pyridoxal phosphate-dependent enzyme [Flavobacteriales bacterium]MBO72826.1 YggS family pyridoxal phosphate-dependent enzyme [Flavobacteriales bacterium]|tara:strand:- start:881 stop:1552 length:672 start_codon:yes stop_codon:yes gene_type:complete
MSFSIKENLNKIRSSIPKHVSLVAVSKTKPIEDIQKAFDAGQRIFGENKVQELREKQPNLPNDIEWHMIGHMQSNKVKYIAPFISLIHGVESFKLIKEINKQGLKNNRVIRILLQFHIADESTKFGFKIEEVLEILNSNEFKTLKNIEVQGVMGMASFVSDHEKIRKEFSNLQAIYEQLKNSFFANQETFNILSMGMSGDYKIAINEGSTMIRLGSSIFGARY